MPKPDERVESAGDVPGSQPKRSSTSKNLPYNNSTIINVVRAAKLLNTLIEQSLGIHVRVYMYIFLYRPV